ncbi:MAG: RluA family pseudouridine synthase [Candidatus Moranbacteria bacterium]|nr:RluA family pseudouridine synthase [Candidatus Moranbacteria bacterium]
MKKTAIYSSQESNRLDKYICSFYPDISRRFFQKAIKSGQVLVNNNTVPPSYKVKFKDEIKINIKKLPNTEIEAKPEKNIDFEIISEYSDFRIINKPAGISVHPSENETGGTLVNGLLNKFPEIKKVGENELRPGIVHRIDKETSGLLIIAKNQKAFKYFKTLFKNRGIEKTYLTWAWGNLKNKSGEIKAFTGKSNRNPTKQAVSHNPEKLINPKEALTYYQVLKELDSKSLIELKPKTGRKHQLRLHLHSIGHPIIGDKKYFNKTIKSANQKFSRHLLHAYKIKFKYSDGKKYQFETKPPKDFEI